MSLLKIREFDPNYKEHFNNIDIFGFDVYSGQDKVGTVSDILVEETGNLRYLVVNVGNWVNGKKVLLPLGKSRFNYNTKRVEVPNFTKVQAETLPNYSEADVIDYDYEEKIRNVYRSKATNTGLSATGLSTSATSTSATSTVDTDRNSYQYNHDADLYALNDNDHQNLKLYEERLIADITRRKTGEVSVGKKVDTETASVSVPLDKERVIVERTTPQDSRTVTNLEPGAFQEGEVARIEVYEEAVNIRKEAFVREEVNVKKVVEQETATGEEQVRRERLEVTSEGKPVVRDDVAVAKKV
jgi:uncharacterized protein (TIGR02271 family)